MKFNVGLLAADKKEHLQFAWKCNSFVVEDLMRPILKGLMEGIGFPKESQRLKKANPTHKTHS